MFHVYSEVTYVKGYTYEVSYLKGHMHHVYGRKSKVIDKKGKQKLCEEIGEEVWEVKFRFLF